jgi:hypothetical protein
MPLSSILLEDLIPHDIHPLSDNYTIGSKMANSTTGAFGGIEAVEKRRGTTDRERERERQRERKRERERDVFVQVYTHTPLASV